MLEWLAMPSSRGSSQPRDRAFVSSASCTGQRVLYDYRRLGSPKRTLQGVKHIASGKLWYYTGASAWCSVMSKKGGMVQVGGRLKMEGIYVYI